MTIAVVPAGFAALSLAQLRTALTCAVRVQSTVRSPEVDQLVIDLGMAVRRLDAGNGTRTTELASCSLWDERHTTVAEVAFRFGVGARRVIDILHDPESALRGRKVGNAWLIEETSVQHELERRSA